MKTYKIILAMIIILLCVNIIFSHSKILKQTEHIELLENKAQAQKNLLYVYSDSTVCQLSVEYTALYMTKNWELNSTAFMLKLKGYD